jgi:hypothetical protein
VSTVSAGSVSPSGIAAPDTGYGSAPTASDRSNVGFAALAAAAIGATALAGGLAKRPRKTS